MDKDVFLEDPFAVKVMLEDTLGKELIKVTKIGMALLYCMSEELKESEL